ncbi:LicD family protein [Breznakia sp. OttesenSCG-928-G09]|nr:LicD family protein [Breznakia sp. OttesenSCG-928-G09]
MDKNGLEKIIKRELEIFDEIVRICKKHDIHYVLGGGSCLGAVRHQGMIPWDDDIDLSMYRADYERFLEVCKTELNENYYVQNMDNEENYALVFGKVRDHNSYFSEKYCKNVKMKKGIWVDIFPYDNVCENEDNRIKEYKKLKRLNSFLTIKCGYVYGGMKGIMKLQYWIVRFITLFIPKKVLKKKIKHLMFKYNNIETDFIFPFGGAYGAKEKITKEFFFDTIEVEFEGRKANIFKGYDTYLTTLYGDYMTPPPQKDREYGHGIIEYEIYK